MGSVSLINGHIDDDTPRMTPQEAKSWFEEDLKDGKCSDDCPECNAREFAISALDKQILKKPIQATQPCFYWCPNCESAITKRIEHSVRIIAHCPFCGQALAWGDNE